MTEQALARARGGDQDAFRELTAPYHRELEVHIYRIVSSVQDAEDVLQDTLLAAWRDLGAFEERASVRAWLYRIATNRSLDALRAAKRRPQGQAMPSMPEPSRFSEPMWIEPYPDLLLDQIADDAPGPDARYEVRETVELAFIVGLQHLPPQQRAVLLLRDVLGYRAAEAAAMLDTSEAAVNNLLRRARAAFDDRLPARTRERAPLPGTREERELVRRFAKTVESGDIDGMVAMLTEDAWVTMPPLPHAYQGHTAIAAFLRGSEERRGAPLRLVATRANGAPAFGCYLQTSEAEPARAYALFVLTVRGDRITAITWFADGDLLARFGLPPTLRPSRSA